jgi:hypothetical protein
MKNIDKVSGGLYHLNYAPTIRFPVSSVGEDARAMPQHRQAFSTPRGSGKSDLKGDGVRLPDFVLHNLWCRHHGATHSLPETSHHRRRGAI